MARILSEGKANENPRITRNKIVTHTNKARAGLQDLLRLRKTKSPTTSFALNIEGNSEDLYVATNNQLLTKNFFLLFILIFADKEKAKNDVRENSGNLPMAVSTLKSFLNLAERSIGCHVIMARKFKDCADFMLENECYDEAMILFRKSNDIYNMANEQGIHSSSLEEQSMLLQNWGRTKCLMGSYQEGFSDFEKSLTILQQRFPHSNKYTYKAYARLSGIFHELHIDNGLKALTIANHLGYMAHNWEFPAKFQRFRREMFNVLGPSILRAHADGVDEKIIRMIRFRRQPCKYGGRCRRRLSCLFAHGTEEERK